MYANHFTLNEMPFSITPDTSFFFSQSTHHQALNTLLVCARSGEGFIKVVGEVGTGKTLLCRKFLAALAADGHFVTAYVPNPYQQPMTLLMSIADELGIVREPDITQHRLLHRLTTVLLEIHRGGKRVVVCLDEAQAIPVETLEALRLLTNLETEKRKLVQVVLFGQPELDQRLEQPSIRQLQQRITFSCELLPLSLPDVEYYIAHRLAVAGYRGKRLFTRQAVRKLYFASRGVPRVLNILAHKSLMAAYGEGAFSIEARHVRSAAKDTDAIVSVRHRTRPAYRYAAAVVATALVSAGALFWSNSL